MKRNSIFSNAKKLALSLAAVFLMGLSMEAVAQHTVNRTQLYTTGTADKTFTVPYSTSFVTLEAWGGGGGGGNAKGTQTQGAGGGGGGYAQYANYAVTAGDKFTIVVGKGGKGGEIHWESPKFVEYMPEAGTASVVSKGGATLIQANGGEAGERSHDKRNVYAFGKGGTATGISGTTCYTGGNGSSNGYKKVSTLNYQYWTGAGGGAAGPGGNGGSASGTTAGVAATGNPSSGNGGAGRGDNDNGEGHDGITYGGGGGGGYQQTVTTEGKDGGKGADGCVRITYTEVELYVTFDKNTTASVSGMPAQSSIICGEDYNTLVISSTPSLAGYTFKGWFLDKACTQPLPTSGKCERTADFTVYPKWAMNLDPGTIAATKQSICKDGSFTGINSAIAAVSQVSTVSYQWQINSGSGYSDLSGATSADLAADKLAAYGSAAGTYIVRRSATDGVETKYSNEDTLVVNDPAIVLNDITSTDDEINKGASATLSISTASITGTPSYVWSPATGLNTTTGSSVTASPTETTTYTVVGTATQGTCTATASKTFELKVSDEESNAPVLTAPLRNALACYTEIPEAFTTLLAFTTGGGVATISTGTIDTTSFRLVSENGLNGKCDTNIVRTYGLKSKDGDEGFCNDTIKVLDNVAPQRNASEWPEDITNQNNCFANADATGLKDADFIKGLYTDCGEVVVTFKDDTVGNDLGWTITRTYKVSDQCGNVVSSDPTMKVSGKDATAPVRNATPWPEDVTGINRCLANADKTDLLSDEAVADLFTDCGKVVVTSKDDTLTGSNDKSWTITRTYTVKDTCGNTVAVNPTMSVSGGDTTRPTFVRPADTTICKDDNCTYDITPANAGKVTNVMDNCSAKCDTAFVDKDITTTEELEKGMLVIERTWRVTDQAGNLSLSDSVQTITVADTTRPTYTRPVDITLYKDGNCTYNASVEITGKISNVWDNCSTKLDTTYTDKDVTPNDAPQGLTVIERTWRLVDKAGNISNSDSVQTITVLDTVRPTYVRPADITIYTNDTCGFDTTTVVTGMITNVWDNCSTKFDTTYTDKDITPVGAPQGTFIFTRTWRLADNAGNVSKSDSVQKITVLDTIRPTFTRPADITLYTNDTCGFDTTTVVTGKITNVWDNCSTECDTSYVDKDITPAGAPQGTYIFERTWRLFDKAGNISKSDSVQKITVLDTIRPTYTRPADITIYKDDNCTYDASVEITGMISNVWDNCSTKLDTTFKDKDVTPIDAPQGLTVIERTWRLADNAGNISKSDSVQTITVADTTRPTYDRPIDITIYTNDTCGFDTTTVVTGMITNVWDNCSTKFDTSYTDKDITPIDACEGYKLFERTWRLVDNAGNVSKSDSVQTITVLDTIRPTFVRPADTIIFKNDTCGYDASPDITGMITNVWDNCSTILDTTYTDRDITSQFNTCEGHLVIERTWRLVDNCGNVSLSDSVQWIVVRDSTAPTFTAPEDIVLYTDENCAFDTTIAVTGDVTDEADNCTSVLEATYVDTDITPADTCKGVIVIKRTWSLVDDCDNHAQDQAQIITIKDTLAPKFTIPADIVLCRDEARMISADSSLAGKPTEISDNCSEVEISFVDVDTTGTDNEYRVIIREWKATDDCGNFAVDTQKITIAPAISEENFYFENANDTAIVLNYGECDRELNFDTIRYTCDIENVNVKITSNAPETKVFAPGSYDFTWTATDSCGFTVTASFTLTVSMPECGTLTEPLLVKDVDGNEYNTIRVGCECWFAENLRAEHYADSTEIPNALTYVSKMFADENANLNLHGRLYDWKAATRLSATDTMTDSIQGACPKGWRLPTAIEVQNLMSASQFINDLKSTDCWIDNAGTNVMGTNIRPSGRYNSSAKFFEEMGGKFYMMLVDSSIETSSSKMLYAVLSCSCPTALFLEGSKENAFSIRCIAADSNAFATK